MTNDKLTQEEEMVFAKRWGNDGPQDEERVTTEGARQPGCGCSTCACKSGVKPLLVIQYKDMLTPSQYEEYGEMLDLFKQRTGYNSLIIWGRCEEKVQVFGVDAPGLDTFTLDQLIDMLEALNRMREAAGGT